MNFKQQSVQVKMFHQSCIISLNKKNPGVTVILATSICFLIAIFLAK